MAPRDGQGSSRGAARRLVAYGLAAAAASVLLAGSTPDPAGSTAGERERPVGSSWAPGDEIETALLAALRAYAHDDIGTARSWAARACELLDGAAHRENVSGPWPQSNAAQLLDVLGLYRIHVHGTRPDLDAIYETVVPQLQLIEHLNRDPDRPNRLRGERVDYHLITHLVTRIGDLRIDYHLQTLQITHLGDVRLDYHLYTRMPEKIGEIRIDYDLIDGRVRSIAGVDVR